MTDVSAPVARGGATVPGPDTRSTPGRWMGGFVGVLAAAAALGVAELAAALVRPEASPLVAVGATIVDLTPRPVESLAIATLGANDKPVLLVCVTAVVALLAFEAGRLAVRRPARALVGVAVLGGLAAVAALLRPGGGPLDALPAVVGAGAGAVALRVLLAAFPASRGAVPSAASVADSAAAVDRRRFLVAAARTGLVAVGGGAAGRAVSSSRSGISESRAAITLPRPSQPAPAPRPGQAGFVAPAGLSPIYTSNGEFYRVDTALLVPKVPAKDWRLRVHGQVRKELDLDFRELLDRPLVERDITLCCVSNEVGGPLVGSARWLGASLAALLREAGVRPGADQIVSRSADGWTCGTPTALVLDGRDAMLAVAMNGVPLPLAHGFPARMVVPGLYGYVSATKWVVDIELSSFESFDAYWVRRGWAAQAPVKTQSRIDVPRDGARVARGKVIVGGVAWAQHRGIAGVEVRVDRGSWQPARLGPDLGIDAWRQWLWEWDAPPGRHRIQVRATDLSGGTQPAQPRPPFPDGATGWHSIDVTVR